MAVGTFEKKRAPDPLPESLPYGTRTTLNQDPLILKHSPARLHNGVYVGEWVRELGRPSSFVHPNLVDWDQWREHEAATLQLAEGITAADVVPAPRESSEPILMTKADKGGW